MPAKINAATASTNGSYLLGDLEQGALLSLAHSSVF